VPTKAEIESNPGIFKNIYFKLRMGIPTTTSRSSEEVALTAGAVIENAAGRCTSDEGSLLSLLLLDAVSLRVGGLANLSARVCTSRASSGISLQTSDDNYKKIRGLYIPDDDGKLKAW